MPKSDSSLKVNGQLFTPTCTRVSQPSESTVEIPLSLLERAIENETVGELEDWLLANNSEFIERMKRTRKAVLAGKTKPLWELKKKRYIE